jgi:hypothetical protein
MQRAEIQRHAAQSSCSQQRTACFWTRGAIGPEGVFLFASFSFGAPKEKEGLGDCAETALVHNSSH